MKAIKIENEHDFVRDPNSKALMNTNLKALHASKKRAERENQTNVDINTMKTEIDEIKNLQQEILKLVKKYQKDN